MAAMVAVVAGALLLAGVGTLVVVDRANQNSVRHSLAHEAKALLAQLGPANSPTEGPLTVAPSVLRSIKAIARLEDAGVIFIGPASGPYNFVFRVSAGPFPLPALSQADLSALWKGREISGTYHGLVYLAYPGNKRQIPNMGGVSLRPAVLVAQQQSGPAAGLGYLLVISGTVLVLAVAVADRLSRRISLPLTEAVAATQRIAAGDLETRTASLPRSYPELNTLIASIDSMAASLAKAQELQRQFLYSVSHELRTPLTSIRGFAEAIADEAIADPSRAAEIIASEARRLERLVRDLLELARLESGSFSLDLRTVELGEVVSDTATAFLPSFEEAGLMFSCDPGPGDCWVTADPDRLAQIIANLLDNALRYANHAVLVRASRRDGRAVVSVQDDGPGISPSDLPHVFERHYRSARGSDRRPSRHQGSGLGLAIVSELSAAMGGGATVNSPLGPEGGTQFEVWLPTAASQAKPTGIARKSATQARPEPRRRPSARAPRSHLEQAQLETEALAPRQPASRER